MNVINAYGRNSKELIIIKKKAGKCKNYCDVCDKCDVCDVCESGSV